MRSVQLFSAFTVLFSFGAVMLDAGTASAAPCCSAPICQQEEPPSVCRFCHPGCIDEAVVASVEELVYDEAEGLCYIAADGQPTGCESAPVVETTPVIDAE